MKERILIADRVHNMLITGLEELGYEIDYQPDIEHERFLLLVENYSGLIVNTKNPVRRPAIDKAGRLKFIARLGSGMDIIDVDYAEGKGIAVFSAPEGNANAVAEHALSMLLTLFNNIHKANASVREFRWEREGNRGRELENLTVGVIGYGHNGSTFVNKMKGLGVKILCYDKYKQRYLSGSRYVRECELLEEVLSESDIISLHIPLTEETREMVNDQFFEKCRNNLTLINTSRGAIVDLESVERAFISGKLYGACLDVLPNENLRKLKANEKEILERLMSYNVIFTPHIAGWTVESFEKISSVILEKICMWKKNI